MRGWKKPATHLPATSSGSRYGSRRTQEEEVFGLRRGDSVIHLTRIAIAERPVEVNFISMPAVWSKLVYELPAQ